MEETGKPRLATETFTTCIQSMTAIPELAKHLLERHGFHYVLIGKLMSDSLEGQFGWHRLTNGGNFFVSVKQLLHSEKKIHCLSLLQQDALLTAIQHRQFDNDISADDQNKDCIWLEEILFDVTLDDIPQSDAAICYYVSGYIARRTDNQRKCSSSKELLISSYCASDVADNLPEEHEKLFEMANRGGLSEPSTFCFATTIVAMQYFPAVASNCEDLKKLLSLNSPCAVFAKASSAVVKSRTFCDLTNVKCSLNQGFSNFFLLRPRFEKYISTRPHYVHIHVNNIKTLPSTANYMVNVCPLRHVTSDSLLTTKLQNNANAQE